MRWLLVAAIAPVVWGSTYLVQGSALPDDSALWGAALRSLPAAVVLMLVVRRFPRGDWWWKSLVLGTLNVGAFFVLLYVAAQTLPSSVASSIMAASPVAMMLVAWGMISERPTARALLGAGLGIAGVALIVSTGTATIHWGGVAASLTAMVMSSVGFVLAKRWSGQVPVLDSTAWQLSWAGLGLVAVAALVEGPVPDYTPAGWAALAYVALVATALAYVAWFAALAHLRAGTIGIIGLLNPVSGVLLGVLVAHESLSWLQGIGIVAVLAGIVVASRPGRARGRGRAGGSPTEGAPTMERESHIAATRAAHHTPAAREAGPARGPVSDTHATASGTSRPTSSGTYCAASTASLNDIHSGGLLDVGIGVGHHRELASAQAAARYHP